MPSLALLLVTLGWSIVGAGLLGLAIEEREQECLLRVE